MRILTLNTWKCDGDYRQRMAAMASGLASLSADVILLQEAFFCDVPPADTAGQLAQALSMEATRAPARHKSRAFEGHTAMSSSGLAVLSRQAVVARHVIPLPTDSSDGERIALLVCLAHQGKRIWFANVHLSHLQGASTLRIGQLSHCIAALNQLAPHELQLLGGDFNCSPDGHEFEFLRSGASPWCMPDTSQNKSTHRTASGQDLDLDHLLLSNWPVDALPQAHVVLDPRHSEPGQEVSDHAAVMLDLPDW